VGYPIEDGGVYNVANLLHNPHLVKLSEMQSYFQSIGASAISKCKAESL
jgi:hypothetical protein